MNKTILTSDDVLKAEDLYELQDSFASSGTPFRYQLTEGEFQWANFVKGKYSIVDFVLDNTDENLVMTFTDPFLLSECLKGDGLDNKGVMLSDDTALQKLFFWLSIND